MLRLTDADEAAKEIVSRTNGQVRLALPLGLGKPVSLVNALVRLACEDGRIDLAIFTALTLERPAPDSDIGRRFLEPAGDRLFGAYPRLLYADLIRQKSLPENISVSEFFLLAGKWLHVDLVQHNYISANYTHARDVLISHRPNVLAQLLAEEDGRFSLSCNTDISADLFTKRARGELDFIAVGETNSELPFLDGEGAILAEEDFAMMLETSEPFELFSAVKQPVGVVAHAIGLHVSRLIKDGGTLQVGIGSIGDAVTHALLLRHRGEAQTIQADCPFPTDDPPGNSFETGLYAVTEMFVGGLLALFEAGVIRREVDGRAIHAGFFVETRDFYRKLRELPEQRRAKIAMMPVSFTNQLYGDEEKKRAARVAARFVNGAMQVSLLGDVMSDTIEDGQVVSGVGGQFNFVEQAFALEGAQSIITLPATRGSGGKVQSNIRWSTETTTVPRHMRDVIVTEYGIARLRGKTDAEVIAALIAIADSRFQDDLIERAKKARKLAQDFELQDESRNNFPGTVKRWLSPHRALLPEFPLGTDFDGIEQELLPALDMLRREAATTLGKLRLFAASVALPPHPDEEAAMSRMDFADGGGLASRALRGALRIAATRDD